MGSGKAKGTDLEGENKEKHKSRVGEEGRIKKGESFTHQYSLISDS